MRNLWERTKIQRLWNIDSTSGGQAMASTFIDMVGYDGCMAMIVGSTHLSSTGSIVIRQTSAMSTGVAWTITKTTGMDFSTGLTEAIILDCYRPLKRYLSFKARFSSGWVNGWAILYGGHGAGTTEQKGGIVKGFTVAMTS